MTLNVKLISIEMLSSFSKSRICPDSLSNSPQKYSMPKYFFFFFFRQNIENLTKNGRKRE